MIENLSIIIPALNEEHYLPLLLDSIAQQKFAGKLQVIVVDGRSEDRTVEVANRFKKIVKDLEVVITKRGIGHQRNVGAKKAKYNYLLFLDADMVLSRNLLNKLVQKIEQESFIVTVSLWPTGWNILDYFVITTMYPVFLFITHRRNISTPGGFIFTTKKIHQQISGFREDVLMGEDVDYGKKALAIGAWFHLFLSLRAYHSPRRARELGRFGLLLYWWKSQKYVQKYGYIKKGGNIKYPYGHYKKTIQERRRLY